MAQENDPAPLRFYEFEGKLRVTDSEDRSSELPDGLLKLYAITDNALHLIPLVTTPRPLSAFDDLWDHARPSDLQWFQRDMLTLIHLCIEGWRLLGDYEKPLASAAGGVVDIHWVVGTSAHEVVLKLADRAVS